MTDEEIQKRRDQHNQVVQWKKYFLKKPALRESPAFWKAFEQVTDHADFLEGKILELKHQLDQQDKTLCRRTLRWMKRLFLR